MTKTTLFKERLAVIRKHLGIQWEEKKEEEKEKKLLEDAKAAAATVTANETAS